MGIGALTAAGGFNIIILCVLISREIVPVSPLCWVIFGEFFFYVLIVNMLLTGLYRPYKEKIGRAHV